MTSPFSIFSGKKVLVTGHTGFKGGWLCQWLHHLGAEVVGVSLEPPSEPSFFFATGLYSRIDSRTADIRDASALKSTLAGDDFDIVFHMAAQSLVRLSYSKPVETFETNVIGTANVLECARQMPSLKAIVVVTSDKCYENKEWDWGYRENDQMGGSDPYSASKGCTELLTASYRNSFFMDPSGPALASVRAGNVFGGGDWAEDRLIPDIIRAIAADTPTEIRNPSSVRPWQHVLEPLSGYLSLAAGLVEHGHTFAQGWNFGPDNRGVADVGYLADLFQANWGEGGPQFVFGERKNALHEATLLRLDSTKAMTRLQWRPKLSLSEAVNWTVDWYKAYFEGRNLHDLTETQISNYAEKKAA
jgi:CDP-glucose 4,6-dehydratase